MNSNEYKFTIEWTDIKAYWKWKKKKFRWNIIKIIIILRVDYDVKYFTKDQGNVNKSNDLYPFIILTKSDVSME